MGDVRYVLLLDFYHHLSQVSFLNAKDPRMTKTWSVCSGSSRNGIPGRENSLCTGGETCTGEAAGGS